MFITNAQTMTRKWPKTMILSKRKITHFCTVSAIYICYHGFDNHSGGLFADCSKCININVLNFRLRELYLFFCETCLMPQLRQSGSNSKNNITSTIFHFFYFFFFHFVLNSVMTLSWCNDDRWTRAQLNTHTQFDVIFFRISCSCYFDCIAYKFY